MPSLPRALLLAVGGTVVAVGAVAGVAAAATGGTVPRGVHVAGVDLSGDTRAEAAAAVRAAVAPRTSEALAVRAAGVTGSLDPASAGLGVDVDAVLDDATSGGPLDRVRGLLGSRRDVGLVTSVDDTALQAALRSFATRVDRAPREGTVRYEGLSPVAVPPLEGRALDVAAASATVREGWLTSTGPLELAARTSPVRSTDDGVRAVAEGIAVQAVAAPVTLDAGGRPLVVQPADVAAALTFPVGADGALVPTLSGPALLKALGPRAAAVERAPVAARIRLQDGRPTVLPSTAGTKVDAARLAAAVQPVLARPAPRAAALPMAPAQPSLTTEQARALRVVEEIGGFTTRFPCCRPRVTNIRRIAELVDGTLVRPGETFSLNDAVGRRTADKGFVAAPQILAGQFVDDVGGGVSQFATTMYNAAFFSGMQQVEHKAHSYYISRYPPGREATVFYPSVDLTWRNDAPTGVLIDTSTTGTSVTVTFYGTKRYDVEAVTGPRTRVRPFEREYVDRPDCTPASGAEGFDITVTRVLRAGGQVVKRQPVTTRYQPEPNFVCGPDPATLRRTAPATPSPSPAASPSTAAPAPSPTPTG